MFRSFLFTLAVGALLFIPCLGRTQGEDATAAKPFVSTRGIFVLSNEVKPIPSAVWANPDVTGVVVRGRWSDMQPTEDRFVWQHFDNEVAKAKKAGKKVILSVSQGKHTPNWVYQAGAQAFSFTESNKYHAAEGQTARIPIPWDIVFLKKWSDFVKALGNRYAKEGHVIMVHMVGPSKEGAEMHLPKTKEDQAHWIKMGYTKGQLIDAWKKVIDAYADAFPNTGLALDIAIPIKDDGVADAVLAYAANKLPGRLHVQHNALSAKTVVDWKPHRLVSSSANSATVGFELVSSATPQGKFNDNGKRFGGSLTQGFEIGLKAGASYFQIYPADVQNQATAKEIHELAMRLNR